MNPGRRGFLIVGGGGALLTAVGPPARAVMAAERGEPLGAADRAALNGLCTGDELSMLRYAALAPSGHNAQPWTVRVVGAQHWVIGSEKSRWLPAVDPAVHETTLSIGAFLENLIVAAGHMGYAIDYKVVARTPADPQLVDLTLRRGKVLDYPIERLEKRRTVRGAQVNDAIKADDLEFVTDGSTDFAYLPRGSREAQFVADATFEAARQQAFRDDAQEELANWIRWSKKDQEAFRNGLTPQSLELPAVARWFTEALYDKESVMKSDFRERGVRMVREQVEQGGGWLVVKSPDSNVATLVETGRKLERMWLKARERMIAIHPMTTILEEAPWRDRVARELRLDAVPQLSLRIGYRRSYPDPVSLRMPIAWFTRGEPR